MKLPRYDNPVIELGGPDKQPDHHDAPTRKQSLVPKHKETKETRAKYLASVPGTVAPASCPIRPPLDE